MNTGVMNRWNTWNGLASLHEELNRLLDVPTAAAEPTVPPVDVLRSKEKLIVRADLPGVTKDDLEVTVQNGQLLIRGEKKGSDEGTLRSERWFGKFERTIRLPRLIAADQVSASFTDGTLEVHIPFREEAKPRLIPIETH